MGFSHVQITYLSVFNPEQSNSENRKMTRMTEADSANSSHNNNNSKVNCPPSSMEDEDVGPGRGFIHFLKRMWYHLLVLFIGGKWSLIETFSKHQKLNLDVLSESLKGRNVVITGGARGIGAEVVKQCMQQEMHVIIGCRNPAAGESLIKQLRDNGISTGSAEAHALDLNSLESVKRFAQSILNRNIPIHLLINNAGVMFFPFQLTVDGFESQFQTNYLSHFLLTMMLQPLLNLGGKPNAPSRVINVSSAAQYGGFVDFHNLDMKSGHSPHMSYMSSKLMQVISTVDLNRRFQDSKSNIRVYSLHPGVVRTDLYQNVWWVNFFGRALNALFKTPEQGADGIMFIALSPSVNQDGGTFYANCSVNPVNPLALNREVQDKLYKTSVELCSLNHVKPFNNIL